MRPEDFRELKHPYYLGIDLSLRLRAKELLLVLNPYVINVEHELPLAGIYTEEEEAGELARDRGWMQQKWKETLEKGDPYYNKHLNRDGSFTFEM